MPTPRDDPPSRFPSEGDGGPIEPRSSYGRPFWLAFASNLLMTIGFALLFRYADFVMLLGGTEFHLGWIVGVGMVGSLVVRLALGSCIDRYGTMAVWIGSAMVLAASCFGNIAVTSHRGAAIYLLRVLFCCGHAGVAGASMTFVSGRGSNRRIAEMIGMLGTSGFLGYMLGALLGDLMLGSVTVDRGQVERMFTVAGGLVLLSCPLAWLAARAEAPSRPSPGSSTLGVLRRHHPGTVLAVGLAMGLGLGLPAVFLRTYAAELHIPRIGGFFMAYTATAIVARVLSRRWPERFGNRSMILLGTGGLVASTCLFLAVRVEWQMILPAIGFGCSHAILFPAVMAAGNVTFPAQHRGLAIVLVLASSDLGQLVGAPATGAILKCSRSAGLAPYPTMFISMAGLITLAGIWYSIASRPAARRR
jgi:MFS family permease